MPLTDLIIAANQFVNIQVEIITKDATGGPSTAWSTLTVNGKTAVPCMIRPASAAAVNDYVQRGIEITNHVLFAFNVDSYVPGGLSTKHRFLNPATGYAYKVQGTGIYDPLILSQEDVYRADVILRRATN